ncbi:hypothetical protein ACH5RR_037182 [Cinchona calisaya]|uniref:Cyclase-like protein 2 n=1 Tax=Cinchona calisaya TaxID=153742 RepID=A0ABD2Y6N5_9GENT
MIMTMISGLVLLAVANIALLTTPSSATTFEGYDGCKVYDISHPIRNGTAASDSNTGAVDVIRESYGRFTITGTLNMSTQLGTHVNSPSYFSKFLNFGRNVDSLDFKTLIGPVLIIQTPTNTDITAKVLRSLQIPEGTKRVIFKTSNTDNCLMNRQAYTSNYTGLTKGGANWLVKNTDVEFVGIDYMSIATKDDVYSVYKILLKRHLFKNIIPVENLKLDGIEPGPYIVYCLPLRLIAEAAPARCILLNTTCPLPTEW